jgi:hypothetical protein
MLSHSRISQHFTENVSSLLIFQLVCIISQINPVHITPFHYKSLSTLFSHLRLVLLSGLISFLTAVDEVEVTLRLTVSQWVCPGVEPTLWLVARYHTTLCPKVVVWKLLFWLCGAPSLTRGRVCNLSFSVCSNLSVFTSSIYVSCVSQFSILYIIHTKLLSVPS